MIKIIVLLLSVLLSTFVTASVITEVPPPPRPADVPLRATYQTACFGVSQVGLAACQTYYTWTSMVGRFSPPEYRYIGYTYSIYARAITVLKPLASDTDTVVTGVTPRGRVWGQSSYRLRSPHIVEWDATGTPKLLGLGEAVAADDLGRIAYDNLICDSAGCVAPPDVLAVLALSNSGDYVAAYTILDPEGIEHVSLWRDSDYRRRPAEDLCTGACLSELTVLPLRVAINRSGRVAWSLNWPQSQIGLISDPWQTITAYQDVPFAAVSGSGEAVGGRQIVHPNGRVEVLPLGAFSRLDSLGVNDTGIVVGRGVLGALWSSPWRAFVFTP